MDGPQGVGGAGSFFCGQYALIDGPEDAEIGIDGDEREAEGTVTGNFGVITKEDTCCLAMGSGCFGHGHQAFIVGFRFG